MHKRMSPALATLVATAVQRRLRQITPLHPPNQQWWETHLPGLYT
uniref:Uncharacterized protein n=1 Tax=Anguilla anguilla TaxID=7936 RepID=A0A0E9V502_ANGAN